MVQGLVDADQPPKSRVVHGHVPPGNTNTLHPVDGDVNSEINQAYKPEPGRDHGDQQSRRRQMDQTMAQQWQNPAGLLILTQGHPCVLQQKIRNHMLDGEHEHPAEQSRDRDR